MLLKKQGRFFLRIIALDFFRLFQPIISFRPVELPRAIFAVLLFNLLKSHLLFISQGTFFVGAFRCPISLSQLNRLARGRMSEKVSLV